MIARGPYPVAFVLAPVLAWQQSQAGAEENWWRSGWAVTGFAGVLSVQQSSDIWFHGDFKLADDTLVGLAASKRLWRYRQYFDLEFEAQAVKHFGGQDNFEFNLPLIVRWNAFPWDDIIDTSIAFGDGPSLATETPDLEKAQYGGNHAAAGLNFVLVELTLALPDHPEIQFVNRLQHRSGAFDLISNTRDASTAFVWGFKFRF